MAGKYKIISQIYENYYGKVFIEYKNVTFEKLCEIKKINIKNLLKRNIYKQSTVRESLNIPKKYWVACLFGKNNYALLFNSNGEAILSSQYSTVKYLIEMGLKPENYGFNSKILKAAA